MESDVRCAADLPTVSRGESEHEILKRNPMRLTIVLTLGLALLMSACSEEPTQPNTAFPFIGTWVEARREGDTTVMRRAPGLDAERYGFVFDIGGKFLERKNAGWCGTPPISYGNFAGEWMRQTENMVHIDVDYWGGKTQYDMRIISLDLTELRFVRETSL